MGFDPGRQRWVFSEEGDGLRRLLNSSYAPGKPKGNYARHDLYSVVESWLVGLSNETAVVLPRAIDWLTLAINEDEELGQDHDYHRATLRTARAMARWMLHQDAAQDDWAQAVIGEAKYWQNPLWNFTPRQIVKESLDDYMAYSVQAGQYAQAIAAYERLGAARVQKLTGKVLKPREYAYAVCLHHEQGLFDEDALFDAGYKMLTSKMDTYWLAVGQSLRAAMWLKIVYWDHDVRVGRTPSLSPLQVVVKAYEHMQDVEMPDYLRMEG
jgi:hypothetical protein